MYRSRQRKRARLERLATVPISNKKIWQDATNVRSDIETSPVSDDADELDRPKRAILIASFDGGSSRNLSVDGKSMDMDTMDQAVGWVPQIKSQYGVSILAPKPSLQKQNPPKSQLVRMEYTPSSLSGNETLAMSPPPSYSVANNAYSIGGVLSGVVEADVSRKVDAVDVKKTPVPVSTPGTPLQSGSAQAPSTRSPATPARLNLEVPAATTVPSPLPSPARSASFVIRDIQDTPPEHLVSTQKISHSQEDKSSRTSTESSSSTSELPRLMTVLATYTPNLEDELSIRIGDTVRMLEEFKDGWCVVQYVGQYNAAKGVVPRVCLQERKSVVPRHRSNTSLASSISGSLRR